MDTWWQTETGGILIAPLPGSDDAQARICHPPVPGHQGRGRGRPWRAGRRRAAAVTWCCGGRGPACSARSTGDDERYVSTYFWAGSAPHLLRRRRRAHGRGRRLWLLGRIDDVMNVSGHRLLDDRAGVGAGRASGGGGGGRDRRPPTRSPARRRCVSRCCGEGYEPSDELAGGLREWIGEKIGKIARPKAVILVADLPKTRSGQDHAPAAEATSPRATSWATQPPCATRPWSTRSRPRPTRCWRPPAARG